MTRNKQDGGPVYPCKTYTQSGHPNGESMGMTLRDYFAGQALAGMNSADRRWENGKSGMAVAAYSQADAMIAERNKE